MSPEQPHDEMSATECESPLLAEFGADAFTTTVHHGMRIAGCNVHGYEGANFIVDLSAVPRRLVAGSGASRWLAEQDLLCPSQLHGWAPLGKDGVIAQLHIDQYLVVDQAAAGAAPTLFASPVGRRGPDCLVFRCDMVEIALGGPARSETLAELCAVDADYACENWSSVRLAHCEVALWHRIAPVAHTRVLCTAADARYLFGVLRECMQSAHGEVIGFDDFLRLSA